MTVSVKYRPDIDGLRAIAVLPVVLYHTGVPGFSGGFVGVDIFFVISGFLITANIYKEIIENNFTIVGFYQRRIRRIFPALFGMLLVTTVVASAILMPVDFKSFCGSLIATALFSSNFFFWLKSGYFDPSAETAPLLHTWSLAVEEQYYVIFPIVMMLLADRLKYWRTVLAVLFCISLGVSIVELRHDATGAFYLPWSRMWELLIGALLSLEWFPAPKTPMVRHALGLIGLALILGTILLYSPTTPFPGLAALPPCLGATLILYANTEGQTLVGRILSAKPLVWVGLISYSLYLWHWPLLAFGHYYLMRPFTPLEQALLFASALLLADLSWRFVEWPFRRGRARPPLGLFVGAGVSMAVAITFGLAGFAGGGLPQRLPPQARLLAATANDINPHRGQCDRMSPKAVLDGKACQIGAGVSAPVTFALLGDSFADALAPGVDIAAQRAGRRGVVLTASGCYPLYGVDQGDVYCRNHTDATYREILSTPSIDTVVIVARWTAVAHGTRFGSVGGDEFFTDAQSNGPSFSENVKVLQRSIVRTVTLLRPRRVIFVAYIPEQAVDVPREAAFQSYFTPTPRIGVTRAVFDGRQDAVHAILDRDAASLGFQVIDIGSKLCDADGCSAMRGRTPLYVDDNHLSTSAAVSLSPLFEAALRRPGAKG
jgi:peptidoglycan/LPS O-acetylase OafA/YrhL